jgi:hypothetical protein
MRMRRKGFLQGAAGSLLALYALLLTGCGGGGGGGNGGGGNGGGGGNPPPPAITRVKFTIQWPERSRNLQALSSTQSVVVTLKNAAQDGSDFVWNINRDANPAANQQNYTSPNVAKVGTWQLQVRLHADLNGTGALVGTAGANVTLAADGTGIGNLVVNGTIQTVEVPAGQFVKVGEKKDLTFATRDASGALVAVTPGSAKWEVVSGTDRLRVIAGGQVEGLAIGLASIRATVDGKTSANADVNVLPTEGSVTVNVRDPFLAPLKNVKIELLQNNAVVRTVSKSETGSETLDRIPVGMTEVRVTKGGFKTGQKSVMVDGLQTPVVTVDMEWLSLPSAALIATRVVSVNGDTVVFEADISVIDGEGNPITNLGESAFTLSDFTQTVSGRTVNYTVTRGAVTRESHAYQGAYSTFLLIDQSGSVLQNDPNDTRLQATKAFLQALGQGDEAMVGYFPESNNSRNMATFPGLRFVTDGTPYYPLIDGLAGNTFLGTPLFNATIQAVQVTQAEGVNPNKAVVIFTDADSHSDSKTLEQAVAAATNAGVRVYTVGVGGKTKTEVLSELALRTGGSVMWTTDTSQMISYYKNLGKLLQGSGEFYRTTWTVKRSPGVFQVNDKFSSRIQIALPGVTLQTPFTTVVRQIP